MKFEKFEMPTGGGNGGGLFLKFADGESKVGVLKGEIYKFHQKWENKRSMVVSASDPEGKLRFRANFATKEDGKLVVKILEFGLMLYQQLAEIADGYEIEKTAIKITRRGTGTDTTYMALPVPPKEQPTAPQLKAINDLPCNMLEHKDAPPQKAVAQDTDEEALPF